MSRPDPEATALVDRALASGPPTVLFQPVVDLTSTTSAEVGYEALARWPAAVGATADLFTAAERTDRVADLDFACRDAAVRSALDAGIDTDTLLFVNVEPVSSLRTPPEPTRSLWRYAARTLRVVLEVTERKILDDASALLLAVREARDVGWLIAVDDLGANPDSLAMLEFIRPDLVKLDLGFVQRPIDGAAARTLRDVSAYCERTGAALIAEGIETEEHLERALEIGAGLGQGYLFGRPGTLQPARAAFRAQRVPALPSAETPFRLLNQRRGYRICRVDVLRRLSEDIERQIGEMGDAPIVIAVLASWHQFGAEFVRRYGSFATTSPLVLVLGEGVPDEPAPNMHGAALPPGDPLLDEWAIIVLGSQTAVALSGQDLGDDVPTEQRRFRYAMTQDRDLVIAAGRSLLNRLVRPAAG